MRNITPARERALDLRDRLMNWLMKEALPIWHGFGIDHVAGGFHEKLGTRCEIRPDPRRTRVLARQIFSFSVAGRLGWTGPWRPAVEKGLAYFLEKAVKPEDGSVRMSLKADGSPLDDRFNLYDQAFALFAFAAVASVVSNRAPIEAAAVRLRDLLFTRFKHPVAGFEEANPRTLPLKANPHMHLLEASLAWIEAGGDQRWGLLADEIVELCLKHFIDSEGWLREFFDGDWSPMPGEEGRICEPGHQFEWAWLLVRWGKLRGRADAIAAAARLTALGEAYGVDLKRKVAVNEVRADGSIRDGSARLWPQTERIKGHAALALAASSPAARDEHFEKAVAGAEALMGYFAVETPGLWRDRLDINGRYQIEPAPASSFYHIICGIEELNKALEVIL